MIRLYHPNLSVKCRLPVSLNENRLRLEFNQVSATWPSSCVYSERHRLLSTTDRLDFLNFPLNPFSIRADRYFCEFFS